MAHHKRKGPKSTRAGCLLCKPHKHQAERHHDRSRGDRRWREQEQVTLSKDEAVRLRDALEKEL